MGIANAWIISLGVAGCILLGLLLEAAKNLLRTLKRIEARLTLTNPTEAEQKALGDDFLTRAYISETAMHPDIWIHKCVRELSGLGGGEYKKRMEMQRYTERTRRS
ncbi:MAG TPA: hypothetical protein VMF56_05905 [Acidobacteriaceae bacterium]|nr:hypothetical protein [Acidobacteriaceae bacterium]